MPLIILSIQRGLHTTRQPKLVRWLQLQVTIGPLVSLRLHPSVLQFPRPPKEGVYIYWKLHTVTIVSHATELVWFTCSCKVPTYTSWVYDVLHQKSRWRLNEIYVILNKVLGIHTVWFRRRKMVTGVDRLVKFWPPTKAPITGDPMARLEGEPSGRGNRTAVS